jgi:hypothetical protein
MPAQKLPAALRGGDPVFAGIHVSLADFQREDVDGRDKPCHATVAHGFVSLKPACEKEIAGAKKPAGAAHLRGQPEDFSSGILVILPQKLAPSRKD